MMGSMERDAERAGPDPQVASPAPAVPAPERAEPSLSALAAALEQALASTDAG